MCLCPFQFARLSLHLEVFVTFGAAEAKCSSIVAHECNAFGRVDGSGAEVASFDSGNVNFTVEPL